MNWTAVQTIAPTKQWTFTSAVTGSYFRIKHTNAPSNPTAWICQAEQLPDGTYQIFDEQPIVAHSTTEIFSLFNRGLLANRCIGIRQKFNALTTNTWSIALEVSDLVVSSGGTDYSAQLSAIRSDIAALSTQIVNLGSGSGGETTTTTANDPFIDSVTLLMHFNGANNSTTFTDIKGHSISRNGNPVISTAQSKFDGSSGYFDGSSSIYLPGSSATEDFKFGSSDFTIEFWFYPTFFPGGVVWGLMDTRTGPIGQPFTLGGGDTGKPSFYPGYGGSNFYANKALKLNEWQHVAYSRYEGIMRIFLNGIKYYAARIDNDWSGQGDLLIGDIVDTSAGYNGQTNGYLDELRITKNVARYIGNFTPSTAPFPNN